MQKDLIASILEYYNYKRNELGYDKMFNNCYPEINSKEDLLKHITLAEITIHYANTFGGRSVGICFDCTWQ